VVFGSALGYGHLYFFHLILLLIYFVLLLKDKKIITYGAISNRYFGIPLLIEPFPKLRKTAKIG
jgi:hypothetical protein